MISFKFLPSRQAVFLRNAKYTPQARLGHADAALQAAHVCLSDKWERLGSDLYGGLPGLSLSLLYLGEPAAGGHCVTPG